MNPGQYDIVLLQGRPFADPRCLQTAL